MTIIRRQNAIRCSWCTGGTAVSGTSITAGVAIIKYDTIFTRYTGLCADVPRSQDQNTKT